MSRWCDLSRRAISVISIRYAAIFSASDLCLPRDEAWSPGEDNLSQHPRLSSFPEIPRVLQLHQSRGSVGFFFSFFLFSDELPSVIKRWAGCNQESWQLPCFTTLSRNDSPSFLAGCNCSSKLPARARLIELICINPTFRPQSLFHGPSIDFNLLFNHGAGKMRAKQQVRRRSISTGVMLND